MAKTKSQAGAYLKHSRDLLGMTQRHVAGRLSGGKGVSVNAVSQWERGVSQPESWRLAEICELLEIDVEKLVIMLAKDHESKVGSGIDEA